jgi:glycosyltransferase involved in cell wall biosynthesis
LFDVNLVILMQDQSKMMPRVLMVDLSDNFGGANARILELMKNLPTNRIGLATIAGSRIACELEKAGYMVHRLATNKFDPRIPFRMVRVIRKHEYQVVDTQNPQSKLWGSIAAALGRAALVSTLNSWYMNEHPRFSLRWFGYSAIELVTNIFLSRYIVVSREIQNAMLRLGIPANKIDLIYNAVKIDASEVPSGKQDLIERYNLSKDAVVCVAAGRLAWAKGYEDLILAIASLAEEDGRVHCVIAGEGELFQSLQTRVESLGLSSRIILAGHLPRKDVLFLIKNADLFVMPSRTEGTPVALLEAAALRTPILASMAGGIPELVVDEEDGLLVPVGDIEALAKGIRRLTSDKSLVRRLVENAHGKVNREFTLEAQTRFSIQSYNKVWHYRGPRAHASD